MALPGARVFPNPGRGAGYVGSGVTFGVPKKKTTLPPKQAVPTSDFWNMPGGFFQDPGVPGQTEGDYTPALPAASYAKLNIPGYTPDWWSKMLADPEAISGQGDYDTAMGNLIAGRRQAIQSAVERAGFRLDPGGDVDEAAIQRGLANPQSTAALQKKAYDTQLADLQARLAARGISWGGGYGAGSQKYGGEYETAGTEARNKLADFINTTTGEATGQASTLLGKLHAAQAAAYARQVAANPARPSQTATRDPGSGLYQAADGSWWDENGNPVGAPEETQAPPVVAPEPTPTPVTTTTTTKKKEEPDWMRALRLRSAALNARYRR